MKLEEKFDQLIAKLIDEAINTNESRRGQAETLRMFVDSYAQYLTGKANLLQASKHALPALPGPYIYTAPGQEEEG